MLADLEIGGWAVAGFFAISGWLIAGSRLNLDFGPFLWRRCLRILPAFWMVLLLTAFVFAPLSSLLQRSTYDPLSALTYVGKNLLLWIFQPTINGTLSTTPDDVWNLSLWTLSWEMICYIAVGALLTVRMVRYRPIAFVVIFAVITLGNAAVRVTEVVANASAVGAGLRLGSFFVAGVMLRLLAKHIALSRWLAMASAGIIILLAFLGLVGALGALPIAYLCLYGGFRLPLARIGSRNDISYGIYVYAYPVGQLLIVALEHDVNVVIFIALNMLLVVPLAWASWIWIEQPALKWKALVTSRRPGTVARIGDRS